MTVCDAVMCAVNVHSMLCYDDEKMSLKETFVASSACQHLVTFLKSLAVSLLAFQQMLPICLC